MKFFESEQKSRTKSCKKYPFRSKLIHDHADFDVTTYLALAKQWKSFAKLNLCAKIELKVDQLLFLYNF